MASPQRVATELARMAMLYRHPLDTEKELPQMVMAWSELCHDITDEQFIAACKAHLRESKFFPCPADILKAHEDFVPLYAPMTALPEVTHSPEEQHRSAVNAAMCFMGLNNPEARKFFSMPDWEAKDAFARQVLGEKYPEPGKFTSRRGPVGVGALLGDIGILQ